MTKNAVAADELRFAHNFTNTLLDAVPEEQWFQMPGGNVTHVGWQVGHIAFAKHVLIFGRILERTPEDTGLLPEGFVPLFGKGSQPSPDPALYPAAAEIRKIRETVHNHVLEAVADLPQTLLNEPSAPRHPAFRDKYGALLWAARHELVHAGQIALLRRELGHEPLR